jgi:hypothetical protein
LNKDFTDKTLWLPTKLSKLSTTESYSYFNKLTNYYNNSNYSNKFLNSNELNSNNFNNLNFFENSRIFLVKKYFFTNNISYSFVIDNFTKYNNFTNKSNLDFLLKSQITFNLNLYKNNLYYEGLK